MDVQIAAFNTIKAWQADWPKHLPFPLALEDPEGLRLHHALWMLEEIQRQPTWKNDKANRWLGYAQGLLATYRVMPLTQLKAINRDS